MQPTGLGFLQHQNPVVRHVVLRRRKSLEEAGLMKPVAVEMHPREPEPDRRTRNYFGATGRAVETSQTLREAYEEAERYTTAMMARNKGAGFMRSLLLQRICSSITAGLATARALANPAPEAKQALAEALEDEDGLMLAPMVSLSVTNLPRIMLLFCWRLLGGWRVLAATLPCISSKPMLEVEQPQHRPGNDVGVYWL